MVYEVEQKFRVAGFAEVRGMLGEIGAQVEEEVEQIDSYFTHPARDFALTDEALRIRRTAGDCYITYKGPKIDTTTKTRREIELPLPSGSDTYQQFRGLLESLGFGCLAEVRKRRIKVHVPWQGRLVEVSLDTVDGVGQFVELELTADAEGLDAARRSLGELAQRLQLQSHERRSYLELLLQSAGRER